MTGGEAKRQAKLRRHGLDFADAGEVQDSRYRTDVLVLRAARSGWCQCPTRRAF